MGTHPIFESDFDCLTEINEIRAGMKLLLFIYATVPILCILPNQKADSECFCQLTGYLDDCSCEIEVLDSYNNKVIYPQLHQLLQRNYFRYYKANTDRKCKFWERNWLCKAAVGGCGVEACREDEIPTGIKGTTSQNNNSKILPTSKCTESNVTKQLEIDMMSEVNRTISERASHSFQKWKKHDSNLDFCDIENEEDENLIFVDLLKNPERYTGYDGEESHKVWRAIYEENCFKPEPWPAASSHVQKNPVNFFEDSQTGDSNGDPGQGLCLEKRIFYRAISGLHSSISIHLSYIYRYNDLPFNGIRWAPNLDEFRRRFDHAAGGQYLKNLYFLYLLEMRAFAKAAPYLESLNYFTGDSVEDELVQRSVKDFLKNTADFPMQFDESLLFQDERAENLKNEFRIRFKNVTSIIDCAACEKCRLWGKLQTHGLGTALKILFTPNDIHDYDLQRNEVVALFNGFGRLSHSIVFLENFQKMALEQGETPVRRIKSSFFLKPEL